jgi:hypothetical protein
VQSAEERRSGFIALLFESCVRKNDLGSGFIVDDLIDIKTAAQTDAGSLYSGGAMVV